MEKFERSALRKIISEMCFVGKLNFSRRVPISIDLFDFEIDSIM